ncbi:sugar transferase [Egbenema bharatensis]|uniref:sugar transferase n=1 Tax=Egbenema bharatensis TaxID=3463334 RepID=UPI003A899142
MKSLTQSLQKAFKGGMDRIVAAIALLILAPVCLIVALAIYLQMGSPILFIQPRCGKNGRIFNFYKFRTLTDDRDAAGNPLPDEQRSTPLGEFLRRSSLDELPQLWNVLKGDMSLVGPRPLVVRYLPRYTPEQARRHEVKPGITGWAQVNGRNGISWETKFKLDVWYVEHWNLGLDLKILLLTLWIVMQKEGTLQQEEFRGRSDGTV